MVRIRSIGDSVVTAATGKHIASVERKRFKRLSDDSTLLDLDKRAVAHDTHFTAAIHRRQDIGYGRIALVIVANPHVCCLHVGQIFPFPVDRGIEQHTHAGAENVAVTYRMVAIEILHH